MERYAKLVGYRKGYIFGECVKRVGKDVKEVHIMFPCKKSIESFLEILSRKELLTKDTMNRLKGELKHYSYKEQKPFVFEMDHTLVCFTRMIEKKNRITLNKEPIDVNLRYNGFKIWGDLNKLNN